MSIGANQYFADSVDNFGYEPTEDEQSKCVDLLERVNVMIDDFVNETGLPEPAMTSGHRCTAKTDALIREGYHAVHNDAHEHAVGIDLGDHGEKLDGWLNDDKLETYGLYRESPNYTMGWVHVQSVPPHSQRRTFIP